MSEPLTTTLQARRLAAGLTIPELARLAACSDLTIIKIENGGTCDPAVEARLRNALGPNTRQQTASVADPQVDSDSTITSVPPSTR